jgi:hypothetical protein
MKKRTEITIETERLLVVSQRRGRTVLWCSDCDKKVPMLTVDEAARGAGTTPAVIFELVEAGKLHFAVGLKGQHFVCLNSLDSVGAQGRS